MPVFRPMQHFPFLWSKPDKEKAAARTTEAEGIRALTSSLRISDGGWNPRGKQRLMTGRMEDGVHVVTYTFEASRRAHARPFGIGDSARDTERMNDYERQQLRQALREIENVANIRFEEIEGNPQQPWKANRADIRYFKAEFDEDNIDGNALGRGRITDVVFSKHKHIHRSTILHETMHALGFSHPYANGRDMRAGGNNPNYNTDTTIMSYNTGAIAESGLGPFDVAVLHATYGKPSDPPSTNRVESYDLTHTRYLYAEEPVTLDLRAAANTGELSVGPRHIRGSYESVQGKENGIAMLKQNPIRMRTVGDTQIKDVLAGPKTGIRLSLQGNALPNRLQGGRKSDTLTPRGGGNTLTGHGGSDVFTLDEKSGTGNVITDFSLREGDVLKLDESLTLSRLAAIDRPSPPGATLRATALEAKNAAGETLASVDIFGVTPKELQAHLESLAGQEKGADADSPSDTDPPGTPPAGLPLPARKTAKTR